jgi:hypothetical protein
VENKARPVLGVLWDVVPPSIPTRCCLVRIGLTSPSYMLSSWLRQVIICIGSMGKRVGDSSNNRGILCTQSAELVKYLRFWKNCV